MILVLPFEEISLQPELCSPTRLRIQGGGGTQSMTDKVQSPKSEQRTGNPCVEYCIFNYVILKNIEIGQYY